MRLLDKFIKEYKDTYAKKPKEYEHNITGIVKRVKDELLDEKFAPSIALKSVLDKLITRSREPMKVAITGQFSSGKSTFLNALLARPILPTGITPVTSKVNFIKYSKDFRLKITYKNGRDEYHSIENISKYTDQRGRVEDIKFLTLYAPLDILKDIIFVDTPGLNSQSNKDTDTTNAILRDVDGIIWLSLIDNAGKMSEAKVLEKYLKNYQNKSLCVLNQKDRFEKDQVKQSIDYVKKSFKKYFADVIAISASQALEARRHQKDVQIFEVVDRFKKQMDKNLLTIDKEQFAKEFDEFRVKVEDIKSKDLMQNMQLLHNSNIEEVLEFIEKEIRPKAESAKEYAIKNDIISICDLLIEQNYTLVAVFQRVDVILDEYKHFSKEAFDIVNKQYSSELSAIFSSLEQIIDKISHEIYRQIKLMPKNRYEESKKFFSSKVNISKVTYEIPTIDSDTIYKNLFYDDETIDKMFKRANKDLIDSARGVEVALKDIYKHIEIDIKKWQNPYELLRKTREIASDIDFANIRKFASKAYENILKDFYQTNEENLGELKKEFGFISGALQFSYQNATKVTVAFLKRKIAESIDIYESNPVRFSLYHPTLEDIKARLKINFMLDSIETLMKSKRNFLYKNIANLSDNFIQICNDKQNFIEDKKSKYLQNIEKLEKIKGSIK